MKSLFEQSEVFTFIYVNVAEASSKQITIFKVLKKLIDFKNVCDVKKINILSKQNRSDHVINLIESAKSSFMFLYNLLQTELTELRRYLETALIKG